MMGFRCMLLLCVLLVTTVASGQQAGGVEEGKRAVALGREGIGLYEQGEWARALTLFEEADRVLHSPVFLLYAARCNERLGELERAVVVYNRIRSEPLPPDAPTPWQSARADAERERIELEPRRASIIVSAVEAEPPLVITIDATASRATLDTEIWIDPGAHRVNLRDAKGRQRSGTVAVVEGQRRAGLLLDFSSGTTAGETTAGPLWPGAVTLGLGLTGGVVGGILGGLALSTASDVKERCAGTACLAEDQEAAERARTMATASTVLLVAGGGLAVLGTVLLVVRPGGDTEVGVGALGPGGDIGAMARWSF